MAEEKQKVEIDLQTLQVVKTNLEQQIKALEIKKSNFEAQTHQSTVRQESVDKLKDLELLQKQNARDKAISLRESRIVGKEASLDQREEAFRDRLTNLQKREDELVDLDKKFAQLVKERSNFNLYKYQVEQQLEQARITIADADATKTDLEATREDLRGREITVKNEERRISDERGQLEIDKKQFEIEKQNKEVINAVN